MPVIASGDITSRAKAQAVLATTGAAAVMVGRGAQGNPWALREIVDGDGGEPTREEVVAELVLFIRETVRELGERRASGFLKKFYGWYLGRGRFPRPFKQELVVLDSTEEVERLLIAAAPGALPLLERLEAELPSRRRGPARPADLDLRRRLGALARFRSPDDPQPLERQVRVDPVERARVRRDQVGEAARRDRLRVDAELARGSGRRSRPPGRRSRRRARTGARRRSSCRSRSAAPTKSTLTSRAARAKSASIETSIPGASTPPTYSPSGETMSKLVEVPKSTTMHGAP